MEKFDLLTQENLWNHSIEEHSVFGDYDQGENRVTCALLHILNYGGAEMIDAFIEAFGGECFNSRPIVSTQIKLKGVNNATKDENGQDNCVDGIIAVDYQYKIYIESKIDCKAIRKDQLKAYKKNVGQGIGEYLLYITPDAQMPPELGDWVYWMNWESVLNFLYEYLASKALDVLLKYLIENFKKLIDKLVIHKKARKAQQKANPRIEEIANRKLSSPVKFSPSEYKEQVLIVGGRWGETIAVMFDFYACQPNRYFLPTKYIAFYYNHRIKYLFEIVQKPIPSIELTDSRLAIDNKYFTDYDIAYKTSSNKAREYFKLKLVHIFKGSGIINVVQDKNGNPCAFVQRQRYTTLGKILKAKDTSQL